MNNTTTKTRCETVDQIVEWTAPDGALQIQEGDLILDGGNLEQVAEIERGIDGGVVYRLDGHELSRHVCSDEMVAVRRYIETTEGGREV